MKNYSTHTDTVKGSLGESTCDMVVKKDVTWWNEQIKVPMKTKISNMWVIIKRLWKSI